MVRTMHTVSAIEINLRPQDRYAKRDFAVPLVDGPFCRFKVDAPNLPGIYRWYVNGVLVYIGRAANLRNRLSVQYGTVSPRHPFPGGQIQKCRTNAKINAALAAGHTVTVTWEATPNYIERERELLAIRQDGLWNIA